MGQLIKSRWYGLGKRWGAHLTCADLPFVRTHSRKKVVYDNNSSKTRRLYNDSGKYRARAVRPPKNRPSSSRTVFHAPAGPANSTKMRTASVSSCGGGWTTCTTTRSTVPFFEHSSPLVRPWSSAHNHRRRDGMTNQHRPEGLGHSRPQDRPCLWVRSPDSVRQIFLLPLLREHRLPHR